MMRTMAILLGVVFLGSLLGRARAEEAAVHGGPERLRRLEFRSIGPAAGGRVARACGVPGDPNTYYAATAAGGVWKSTDGGVHWKPIFDEQPVSSIGSIAVAPSDPNVIYVGSGEGNIRGNVAAGNGIYKSTDAGKTWHHVWKQEGQIGTMLVHPKNPNIAFAAVLGHAFGPNEERGVYRTTDGGKTWQRVLFKDRDSGAADVCLDASSPQVLFAGLWQTRRLPWQFTSGGPGSGLYTSRDGGDSWVQLVPPPEEDSDEKAPPGKEYCKGLPEGIWGKVCVAVAPSEGRRVYALIEAEKGGLFRSDDGGKNWSRINESRAIQQRAWYFSTLTVDPKNPEVVWFPQVPLLKSVDGGKTLQRVKGPHHGDHHDIWIDPKNPKRIIDSNDGGVDISVNGGETWFAPPLPIGQFYRIEVDNSVPYRVMGSMQDIGTGNGPSNSLSSGGIPLSDWWIVGGGEAGHVVPDPSDPNIIYAGEYGGYISRYDRRTRQAQNISIYPFNPSGHGAEDLKYRFQWTAPIALSPHDAKTIYHGANVLFRSTDAGKTWAPLSPDLTRNEKSKQKWSGGPITGDNTGVEVYCTLFAIAESPKEKGVIWVGSDDGLVHLSRDGGKSWNNVTPRGLPEWATILCIEPSPFEAGTAYVVAENHRQDDMKPYLFRTTNHGKTWQTLSGTLPQDVYLHVVRTDPAARGMLYVGHERGVAFSSDDGATWEQLKLNLPTVAVTDLKVKGNDLVVGTMGRSVWILDEITPLRQMTPQILAKKAHFFPPVAAIRYRHEGRLETPFRVEEGKNPPEGAILHYYLKEKPAKKITLEVVDARGTVVQTLSSEEEHQETPPQDEGAYSEDTFKKPVLPTQPGLHRFEWDLRERGATVIKGAKVDTGNPRIGPLVPPGTYTLKLTVGDQVLEEKVEVKLDPRVKVAPEVLAEQYRAIAQVRESISKLAASVNQLRALKAQVKAREELLKDRAAAKPLLDAEKELVKKLDALEAEMHNPRAKVPYDILAQRGGAKLYSQLVWLYEQLLEHDGPVTQGWKETYAEQSGHLRTVQEKWQNLLGKEVAAVNALARKLDLPGLIVP